MQNILSFLFKAISRTASLYTDLPAITLLPEFLPTLSTGSFPSGDQDAQDSSILKVKLASLSTMLPSFLLLFIDYFFLNLFSQVISTPQVGLKLTPVKSRATHTSEWASSAPLYSLFQIAFHTGVFQRSLRCQPVPNPILLEFLQQTPQWYRCGYKLTDWFQSSSLAGPICSIFHC